MTDASHPPPVRPAHPQPVLQTALSVEPWRLLLPHSMAPWGVALAAAHHVGWHSHPPPHAHDLCPSTHMLEIASSDCFNSIKVCVLLSNNAPAARLCRAVAVPCTTSPCIAAHRCSVAEQGASSSQLLHSRNRCCRLGASNRSYGWRAPRCCIFSQHTRRCVLQSSCAPCGRVPARSIHVDGCTGRPAWW